MGPFIPKELKPGTVMHHNQTGSKAVLKERKADDTGWWVEGGGGLGDRVAIDGWTPDQAPGFSEQSLRLAIIQTWGPAGAHIDVYDTLLRQHARFRDALEGIAQGASTGCGTTYLSWNPSAIAREALNG